MTAPPSRLRRARIASGADVKRYRHPGFLDQRPHRVVDFLVVVGIARVLRIEHRLARQREAAESELRDALDFRERAFDIGGRERRHRRHPIVVRRVGFPRPVIPHAALRLRELRIRGGPHEEALVGKNDLGIDAVAAPIFQPLRDDRAGLVAHEILALEDAVLQPRAPQPVADHPLDALRIDLDARQPRAILLVEALVTTD